MDRKDKLKLLQDLSRGTRSLDDLKPKRLRISVDCPPPTGKGTTYYINDKQVTEEVFNLEFDQQLKKEGGSWKNKKVAYVNIEE